MNTIINIDVYMRALGGLLVFATNLALLIAILAAFIIKVIIFIKNNHKNKDNDF